MFAEGLMEVQSQTALGILYARVSSLFVFLD